MRAVVTGAAGFIGSHLVERLVGDGWSVAAIDDLSSGTVTNLKTAMDAGEVDFHQGDVASQQVADLIVADRPDVVFHLAAQVDVRKSVADPLQDVRTNVLGTVNVLQAACASGVAKVVFTSSGGCIYGEPDGSRLPVTEDQVYLPEAMPESPYGVSKKVALDYLRYYRAVQGLDYTALALANVYGPRQEPASEIGLEGQVVAIFCRRMLANQRCTIFGDGKQTRDFVYVDDVVDAFVAAATKGSGELVNVGSGTELSINDLYRRVAACVGWDQDPEYAPARPGELQRISVDRSKAASVLGWEPRVGLDDGLQKTVEWFASHPA